MQTFTVTSPGELYRIIEEVGNNIHDIRICTDEVVEVDVSKVEEEVIPIIKTDIFIAVFTTAWARLELYKYLKQLKEQVLYFDTDSIIYLGREGLSQVETRPFLGQMKDETASVPIIEFVSGAPKNYGYQLQNGDMECKVRGFILDEEGCALLNFESMKQHILAELYDPDEERRTILIRATKKICLTEKVKRYGLVFDNRVIKSEDCSSRYYGYD